MAAVDQSKSKTMTITLMVTKKGRKIMYAEAGKDFVDLLFSFLMIPAGAIAKQTLVSKSTKSDDETKAACCIKNLYDSVQKLSPSLLKADKAILLDPKVVSTTYTNDILGIQSPPRPQPAAPPRFFLCVNIGTSYNHPHSISTERGTVPCSSCGGPITRELKFLDKPPEPAKDSVPTGYVKKRANFAITDDLSVIPINSTATIVDLWNKLDVKDPTELEERTVTVGSNEVIGLLRAAMFSTTALNDVFKAGSKYLTPALDMETTGISLQELLIRLLIEDQKNRSSSKVTA